MQVFVTLSNLIGNGLGPNFVISTDVPGLISPNVVTKAQLISGVFITVPDSALTITCTSVGGCQTSITLNITGAVPTTTSTTNNQTTTTSSTTTVACQCYTATNITAGVQSISYRTCNGVPTNDNIPALETRRYCAKTGSILVNSSVITIVASGTNCITNASCNPTTTTSSSTSTTSTTTAPPTTTSTTTVVLQPTTTTSSTSTSSTTSSTTTVCCKTWNLTVEQDDLDDATGNVIWGNNKVYAKFLNCASLSGSLVISEFSSVVVGQACSCLQPQFVYYKNDVEKQATGLVQIAPSGTCVPPTTTTSTTTIDLSNCFCVRLTNTDPSSIAEYTAINCTGANASGILQPLQVRYLCLISLDIDEQSPIEDFYPDPEEDTVEYNTNCTCLPTTTSTTTEFQTTTSTTTCNCVDQRQVNITISGGATSGDIRAITCENVEIFIPVEPGVNIIAECIKLGSLQNVGNTTITDQLGGSPCCQ